MSRTRAAWLAATLLVSGAGQAQQSTPAPGDPKDVAEAAAAAKAWLALLDAGKYDATWEQMESKIKEGFPLAQWRSAMREARDRVGPLKSRTVKSQRYWKRGPQPDSGDAEIVILEYTAAFTNRGAIETLWLMREKGKWRVATYGFN